ncbi:MAG: ABC transporter permease subunit [Deltaproteobacteria bacterium]|nr:ABC transporter permease subunit [Deltaproteobacteria bacterium]
MLTRGGVHGGYHWQWYRIPRFFGTFQESGFVPGPILTGLSVTLQVTVVSLAAAMVVGLLTALLRLSGSFIGRTVALVYLEVIRNTPLVDQGFVLPNCDRSMRAVRTVSRVGVS